MVFLVGWTLSLFFKLPPALTFLLVSPHIWFRCVSRGAPFRSFWNRERSVASRRLPVCWFLGSRYDRSISIFTARRYLSYSWKYWFPFWGSRSMLPIAEPLLLDYYYWLRVAACLPVLWGSIGWPLRISVSIGPTKEEEWSQSRRLELLLLVIPPAPQEDAFRFPFPSFFAEGCYIIFSTLAQPHCLSCFSAIGVGQCS